jgi:hypothetical protein
MRPTACGLDRAREIGFAKGVCASVHAFCRRRMALVTGLVMGPSPLVRPPANGRSNDRWRRSAAGRARLPVVVMPLMAGASCARLSFSAAVRSIAGGGVVTPPGLTGEPFSLATISPQRRLIPVAMRARVKSSGALFDDGAGDRDHLAIEIAGVVAKLRRPNLVCSAQRAQRHARPTRLDHHHPLAPAERQTADPDDTRRRHCGTNHPQRCHCDRTIGVEVIGTIKITGSNLEPLRWLF